MSFGLAAPCPPGHCRKRVADSSSGRRGQRWCRALDAGRRKAGRILIPQPQSAETSACRSASPARGRYLFAIVLLLLLGAAMVESDPHFTLLDDETAIVAIANRAPGQTVELFLEGAGVHEHPPLSDLLLHYWLPAARHSPRWIRLPSILLYLAALMALFVAATRLGGESAGTALVWIAILWPFGFHFGRLIGWYSLSFLLVALLTLAYLRCVHHRGRRPWVGFTAAAVALVYTNYFGWAVIACLALDFLLRYRRREVSSRKPLVISLLVAAVAFSPLAIVCLKELHWGPHLGWSLGSRMLYGIYNFYALFVSESVAPWFWALSIPVALAIAAAVVLAAVLASREGRRFLGYFLLLFGVMTLLGIGNTKRLLFIAVWLLLALATAAANSQRPKLRALFVGCLGFIALAGWFGIVSRRHYASQHFLEPWPQVAQVAARAVRAQALVVANNPSFFFYLDYALAAELPPSEVTVPPPGYAVHPRVFNVGHWNEVGHPTRPRVLFVRGVSTFMREDTLQAQDWLGEHCTLREATRLLPDSGSALKRRYFSGLDQIPYRVNLLSYDCPQAVK